MLDHPVRLTILLTTIIIALRTTKYVHTLKIDYAKYRSKDSMIAALARDRLVFARWLAMGQCIFIVWGSIIMTVNGSVGLRAASSALCVLVGQLVIAYAVRHLSKSEDRFQKRFINGRRYYCSNLACETRQNDFSKD